MADFSTLKEQVAAVIKANGTQSITGTNFQAQLFNIIDSLNSAKADAVTGKGLSTNDLTNELLALVKGSVQETRLLAAIADAVKNYVAKADVVQATGTDTEKVMSQKATSAALAGKVSTTDGVTKSDIVSEEGSSATKVMSQQIVTNALTQARTQISSNSSAIASNKSDIARVNETLGTHTQQIADNAEDIETNATAIDAINALDERLKLLLGYSATRESVTLELGESGKYVQCASRSAVANSSFAISKPFDVDACSELLIKTGFNPSDDTHKALDLSVISIFEQMERQRTVQKKDSNGNPLYYVVEIDPETGAEKVTTEESTTVSDYPVYTTETYTETRYLPNNEDRFVSIPDSGYYVANIPQSCKVAISYKPGVTDTTIIVEKHGAIANLISQVFGIYEHRTMVEAMVSLAERVKALEESRDKLGLATAGSLDATVLTSNRYPIDMWGKGTPSEANVPENLPEGLPWDGVPKKIGQRYIDLSAGALYFAVGTNSVSDWKKA